MPDAPDEVEPSPTEYEAHLARIRAGECFGLGARVGTRGVETDSRDGDARGNSRISTDQPRGCLVIIESGIDIAREAYYDPEAETLVAEYIYDPMNSFEGWTLGDAECAGEPFVESEHILCGGP